MKKDQYFFIRSKHSGRVLDVCQDPEQKGILIIYDKYGGQNQKFTLKENGLEVQIISKQTNKLLTVSLNSAQNGAPIIEENPNGNASQRYRFQEVQPGSGEFIIYTFCGKVLDCCEAGKSNGTKIIQWQFNGGDNQKWLLEKV